MVSLFKNKKDNDDPVELIIMTGHYTGK